MRCVCAFCDTQAVCAPTNNMHHERDVDLDVARKSILSPYYPTALSVAECPKRQTRFTKQPYRWYESPEKFLALEKDKHWIGKLEMREEVISGWTWQPEYPAYIAWAKDVMHTDIEPVVLGGYYGNRDRNGIPEDARVSKDSARTRMRHSSA